LNTFKNRIISLTIQPPWVDNKFIILDEIINDTVEGTMTGVVIELKKNG
jgi:hypothetical protein